MLVMGRFSVLADNGKTEGHAIIAIAQTAVNSCFTFICIDFSFYLFEKKPTHQRTFFSMMCGTHRLFY